MISSLLNPYRFASAAAALPIFVGQGTAVGSAAPGTDLVPGAPPGVAIGNLVIAQVGVVGTGSIGTLTCATPPDWTLWYNDTTLASSHARQFIYGGIWDGNPPAFDWNVAAPSTGPGARARLFAIQGSNGFREGANLAAATNSNAIAIPPVAVATPNSLVLALASTNGTTAAPGEATGETGGGDYVAQSNYSAGDGSAGMIFLQRADMVAPGTLANAVISLGVNTPNWVCRAFSLQPG